MPFEHEPAPKVIPDIQVDPTNPEVGELSYTEYSLIRNLASRLPHPLRRINAALGEFLDGMGAI